MKVDEVYTRSPRTCGPDSKVPAAAWVMWEEDCGAVPVVDESGHVKGMISDRDITIATITLDRRPSELFVREVMTGAAFACHPEDDVAGAMRIMADRRVRRLPVVDAEGRLLGILSITDLVRRSVGGELGAAEVVRALGEICTPWKKRRRVLGDRRRRPRPGPSRRAREGIRP